MSNVIKFEHAINRLRRAGCRPKSAWTMQLIRQMERRNAGEVTLRQIDRDQANSDLKRSLRIAKPQYSPAEVQRHQRQDAKRAKRTSAEIPSDSEYAARLNRIKGNLNKINDLMAKMKHKHLESEGT